MLALANPRPRRREAAAASLTPRPVAPQTSDIGSVLDVEKTGDPEGLKVFWLLARDLRELTISLINIHFKVKPI
jgi:protein mago nashi